MILTWFRLWPLLVMPLFIIVLFGVVPEFSIANKTMGGFLLRDFLVNTLFFLLPQAHAEILYEFYLRSNNNEYFVLGVIALNINMALMPFLYGIGTVLINLSSWFATTELDVKTKIARR